MNGAYAMSEHAIEAYGDALRRELMFLGPDVVLVQPGPFRSGMTASIRRRFQESTAPGSPFAAMAAVMGAMAAGEDDKATDPSALADAVWTAGTTARPHRRYAVRHRRYAARWDLGRRLLDRLLPVAVVDKALVLAPVGKINAKKLELSREAVDARAEMSEVVE